MFATIIPDIWFEPADITKHSAFGALTDFVLKGTSTDGVAIEIPFMVLGVFDGDRITHMEMFDPDQRDLALTRFDELNQPA